MREKVKDRDGDVDFAYYTIHFSIIGKSRPLLSMQLSLIYIDMIELLINS